jgi:hypothetical protein
MSKMKFTAIHPVKGVRRLCYVKRGYVYFAPGFRFYVKRRFLAHEVTGLLPAKG